VSRADDHLLERILQGEPAQSWLARLTDVFFDQDAKRQLLAVIRALRAAVRHLMTKAQRGPGWVYLQKSDIAGGKTLQ
jgi:hypothetical protein